MSWGKKSKKKPNALTNYHLLVYFITLTGPSVTRCTGMHLAVVEKSWKKKLQKTNVLTNFSFLVNSIRHTGPMVTMVTRCTGSLSQLPVVKMSWEKNLRKNQVFQPSYIFWSISSDTLVPWSLWSPGAQAAYLSFLWSK